MKVAIIGAGPAGLIAGAGLARRGHEVLAVDRDPGPPSQGRWQRRGVMQFEHAHGFRPQVPQTLSREWPEALQTWLALGAEPRETGAPGSTAAGMSSRRVTFERALRRTAASTPRLEIRQGHVDGLVAQAGRVVGVRVDSAEVEADLVIDASGRAGISGAELGRRPVDVLGGDCGIAYVNRTYRLLPGASPGPTNSPLGWFGSFDGYLVLLFVHEQGHYTVVVVRPTANVALKELRHDTVFDAACRAIPALADWVRPERSVATSTVMVGGALRNTYHPQRGTPGLVTIGDAVSTTAPTAGRGVAMACLQIDELLHLLDDGHNPPTVGEPFGAWCDDHIRPWVHDHIRVDEAAARRWQGQDVDLSQPLPSDLIVAAAQAEPTLWPQVGPYLAMTALPETLAPAEPVARAAFRTGWRPPFTEGPTVGQLIELIATTRRQTHRTAS
jgi:2-polyprenyl-6-methoxyphenol hydroxylase-like FAD-dependent oxidoreductase